MKQYIDDILRNQYNIITFKFEDDRMFNVFMRRFMNDSLHNNEMLKKPSELKYIGNGNYEFVSGEYEIKINNSILYIKYDSEKKYYELYNRKFVMKRKIDEIEDYEIQPSLNERINVHTSDKIVNNNDIPSIMENIRNKIISSLELSSIKNSFMELIKKIMIFIKLFRHYSILTAATMSVKLIYENMLISINNFINDYRTSTYNQQTIDDLKNIISFINKKYYNPQNNVTYYTHINDGWRFASTSDHYDLTDFKSDNNMQPVFDSIVKFFNSEDLYKKEKWRFKYGCLLIGPPGTKKTSFVRILASIYKYNIYNMDLLNSTINNENLLNLLHTVPSESIILFDEIDKQLENIYDVTNNKKLYINALFSGLDGCIPIENRVIIIMTSNIANFLDEDQMKALCRKGRIDDVFYFN
jgi:hypothetical protein